jgi:hypothetical protein
MAGLALLGVSCMHTRSGGVVLEKSASVKVLSGTASLTINGTLNEDVYAGLPIAASERERGSGMPAREAGTVTKSEKALLRAGESYAFTLLPSEVVTINARSADGEDVKVLVVDGGMTKEYSLSGLSRMGLTVVFQHR